MAFKESKITSIEFNEDNGAALVSFNIEDTEAGQNEITIVVGSKKFEGITDDAERISIIESFIDDVLPVYHEQMVHDYQQTKKEKTVLKLSSTKKYTKLKVK